ncbi:MAG: hypothetical protein NVSMB27_41360 [Ktedonobacteraceae bacterium]
MGVSLVDEQASNVESVGKWLQPKLRARLRSWSLTWEIYPIVLVASFLRLYRLDITEFATDQSVLYRLAYDALHQGLIPVTSNSSSIFTMNPPLHIYILMIPAMFSSDPLWAVVMTALFNVIAVIIAYIFTRRYYGRLAAIIAALLYATAETNIVFSRFIWQPNMMAPFVILFLCALYWGVVERRRGWLFPALLLLGVMYQLHGIAATLVLPLVAALFLAPWRAIRLRDILLAFVSLLIIFAPFIVWEITSNFADVHTILSVANQHDHIDSKALTLYQRMLNSYYYDERTSTLTYYNPTGKLVSLVISLLPVLDRARQMLVVLLLGGFATAGILVIRSQRKFNPLRSEEALTKKPWRWVNSDSPIASPFTQLYDWWIHLRADPFRCGLVVLLVWQIGPLLLLSRHTAPVYMQYLLILLPGQFILIGFFIACTISWLQKLEPMAIRRCLSCGIYTITAVVLIVQLIGCTASLIDNLNGINNNKFMYNGLGSLQHALQEADLVAQQHHLKRVFIAVSNSDASQTSLPFLAEQMRIPATLFDATRCLVLPPASEGPVVVLIRSSDGVAATLLSRFTTATLIDQPPLLGSPPFQLYIATPHALPAPTHNGFVNHLQLLDAQAQQMRIGTSSFIVTRWTMLHNEPAKPLTSYTYIMRALVNQPGAFAIRSDCMLISIRVGDQLLTTFQLPQGTIMPPSFGISTQYLTMAPYDFSQGPLHFESGWLQGSPAYIQAMDGSGVTVSRSP